MRHGLFLPPFDELADPQRLVRLALAAEDAGWDGFFLWDHLDYPGAVSRILDPYVCLAAVANATGSIQLGPMITPLTRRSIAVLARQILALEALSEGRLIVGLGLGDDDALGERHAAEAMADPSTRGRALSEGVALLREILSGNEVNHHGEFYRIDGVRFLPSSARAGGIPIWLAARWPHRAPLRRAALYEGVFEIFLDEVDNVLEVRQALTTYGADLTNFEIVVWSGEVDATDAAQWTRAGVTWLLRGASPFALDYEQLLAKISLGPLR